MLKNTHFSVGDAEDAGSDRKNPNFSSCKKTARRDTGSIWLGVTSMSTVYSSTKGT